MKKSLLIMLALVTICLAILDIGAGILLYLNPLLILIAFIGFYVWAASGEGPIGSAENVRRGADGAVLFSWIAGLIGLVAILAGLNPLDVEGLYTSLSVCFLPLLYGYTVKFIAGIFVD